MVRRTLIRGQAALLALLLMATPLALLARPSLRVSSKCNGMCCQPRKSRSATPALPSSPAAGARTECHRGTAVHLAMCLMPTSPVADRVAIEPLPPAILMEQETRSRPPLIADVFWTYPQVLLEGFASLPFEPPRS